MCNKFCIVTELNLINWLPIEHLSARSYFLTGFCRYFQYSTYPINIHLFLRKNSNDSIWCSLDFILYYSSRINIYNISTYELNQYLPKQHLTELNLTNKIVFKAKLNFCCGDDCKFYFIILRLLWWMKWSGRIKSSCHFGIYVGWAFNFQFYILFVDKSSWKKRPHKITLHFNELY